jgi:hypothetical protein
MNKSESSSSSDIEVMELVKPINVTQLPLLKSILLPSTFQTPPTPPRDEASDESSMEVYEVVFVSEVEEGEIISSEDIQNPDDFDQPEDSLPSPDDKKIEKDPLFLAPKSFVNKNKLQ